MRGGCGLGQGEFGDYCVLRLENPRPSLNIYNKQILRSPKLEPGFWILKIKF